MDESRRMLIIGLDGLRPDLFEPELMPELARLIARGVRFPDHHAAYPTHTRVQISTLATGAYPRQHGLVANVFLLQEPEAGAASIVDTANVGHLQQLDGSAAGPSVLRPTIGDILEQYDKRVAVAATSTPGAAILWTRNQPYRLVNPYSDFGRADLLSLREKLGAIPPSGREHLGYRQMYAARAVTEIFLHDEACTVVVLWLNEPDSSLHGFGIGSSESRDALRVCDDVIGFVLGEMDRIGCRDQFDVFALSDHGHSTVKHQRSLGEFLDRAARELGLPQSATASDFAYLPESMSATDVGNLVSWVQRQPWAGAVVASDSIAELPGVLDFEDFWCGAVLHERAPTFAVTPAWTDEKNDFGVPGTVAALTEQVALRSTHGSASPYDLHGFLAASGPSFHEGVVTDVPTGAVDLVPTILHLLGIPSPDGLDGRVIREGLLNPGGENGARSTKHIEPRTPYPDGRTPVARIEQVGHTSYLDRITS